MLMGPSHHHARIPVTAPAPGARQMPRLSHLGEVNHRYAQRAREGPIRARAQGMRWDKLAASHLNRAVGGGQPAAISTGEGAPHWMRRGSLGVVMRSVK